MKEFINPKSMLTPGLAGSLMMFLVNGIAVPFPEIPSRYVALFLSFLIGASIIWFSEIEGKSQLLQKAMYWVLNSLVILVVGFGATNLAADVTGATSKVVSPHGQLLPFVSSAFAQNDSSEAAQSLAGPGQDQATSSSLSDSQSNESLNEQLTRQKAENERLKKQLESLQKEKTAPTHQESESKFFKRW